MLKKQIYNLNYINYTNYQITKLYIQLYILKIKGKKY